MHIPRTGSLTLYMKNPSPRTAALTDEQLAFVDDVYELCERNYSAGGDTICECYEPSEIVKEFKTLADVRDFCGLRVEAEQNARWGEDTDPKRPEWES